MSVNKVVKVDNKWDGKFLGEIIALGVDYEELSNGVGQYTTAIVLNPDDGRLHNISLSYLTVVGRCYEARQPR